MKVSKQRCTNCPARNNRVAAYDFETGMPDRTGRLLCSECIAILRKLILNEALARENADIMGKLVTEAEGSRA